VIIHELSHQWFGDLVTMKWWDDLWLNESFARVMEYVGAEGSVSRMETVGKLCGPHRPGGAAPRCHRRRTARKVPVRHPDEISTLFDPSIVYDKGSSLINMMMNYVGPEAFRKGLTNILRVINMGTPAAATCGRLSARPAAKTSAILWTRG
jgi:aminopeptidase N